MICIPTTAGTGSEATRFTVITDTETDEKMLIAGLGALPLAANQAELNAAGVMIGRHAIRNPWIFRQCREAFAGQPVLRVKVRCKCSIDAM